jgi:hypothetical protein
LLDRKHEYAFHKLVFIPAMRECLFLGLSRDWLFLPPDSILLNHSAHHEL